eukprot:10124641-Prorocentrum_lima.AAC.1
MTIELRDRNTQLQGALDEQRARVEVTASTSTVRGVVGKRRRLAGVGNDDQACLLDGPGRE